MSLGENLPHVLLKVQHIQNYLVAYKTSKFLNPILRNFNLEGQG